MKCPLLLCTPLLVLAALHDARAQADADAQLPAVAQEYLAPAASLSPQQVGELQKRLLDWPQLGRYRADNARLPTHAAGRVVFYGDSITDAWGRNGNGSVFFPGKPYLNRGISGQTTAQMLVRFRQDVVDLHPEVVVILAGTNDIAGNTGPATLAMIEDNLRSMAELARAHDIRVVLASVLPASAYPWRPGYEPAAKIRALNAWIGDYARATGAVYLDYYAALANAEGGLDPKLATDGVHPTAAGYAIMAPLAQRAIEQALGLARRTP
ncbi:MAG: SGNH/GDSL hydrolase family protein [Pseudoxanthomonas sp.]